MTETVEEIRKKIADLFDQYAQKYGDLWPVGNLDALEKWFKEAENLIESLGGRVVKDYVAPNGCIVFEINGEQWCADLTYGFFKLD